MYKRKQTKKKVSPLKLPSPPKSCLKYKDVASVIDSGPNVRSRETAAAAARQYYQSRPDELFGRIQPATLVTLMVEIARLQQEQELQQGQQARTAGDVDSLVHDADALHLSAGDAPPTSIDDQPYLLLDVRDAEEFSRHHIATARHYPAGRLARAVNYETAEMWHYRRHKHALVVLCDEDESVAARCATTLAQRGYENVLLLSGGLGLTRRQFPRGLMTSDGRRRLMSAELELLSETLRSRAATAAPSEWRLSAVGCRSCRSACSTVRSACSTARSRGSGPDPAPPPWRL